MKGKKLGKVFIFIGILLVIFLVAIGYLVVRDLKQEALLKQEIVNLTNKDLFADNFDIEVKTTGNYAYIEEAIKTYYKKLSDSGKAINTSFSNDDMLQILSVENLESDGPNFEKSYETLRITRESLQQAMDVVIDLCNEDTIKNLIDKDKVDEYSYELYLELMYTKDDLKELDNLKGQMESISNNVNAFLDKIEEVINFLKSNSGKWFIEDGQLYFETNDLVDQYNVFYNELKGF